MNTNLKILFITMFLASYVIICLNTVTFTISPDTRLLSSSIMHVGYAICVAIIWKKENK